MTGRPRPKARARALDTSATELGSTGTAGLSQTTDPSASQQAAKPREGSQVDEEEDDDFFAHRRRLMRRVASRDITTPPPPVNTKAGSGSDEGRSAKKRKRSGNGDDNWVKSGVPLLPEVDAEETISADGVIADRQPTQIQERDNGDPLQRSESLQRSPLPARESSPLSDIDDIDGASPLTPEEKTNPPKGRQDDSEDEDDEDPGAALDPSILAQIQARYLTAQALSGSDKLPFQTNETAEVPCHIVVECRLDPIQEKDMTVQELKEWGKKRVFEAPRKDPLTGIYDTVGSKLGITSPTSNLVMTLENGTRIWSCYATPESLKLAGVKTTLLAYERSHFERIEEQRREVEAARFQGRLARKERTISPDLAMFLSGSAAVASSSKITSSVPTIAASSNGYQEPIEVDSDSDYGAYQPTAAHDNYSSDIEILDDLPRQAVFEPTPTARSTETPLVSASLEVQVRGQSGQLSGSVSSTTTYDAIIKWYANEMKIPIETAAKGRGKDRVPKKRLKIDFDGDLFDGPGKILDLDLEGGETLDIKYV